MLTKPNLADRLILAQLQKVFGLPVMQLIFLPLGTDVNTAVYRATTGDGQAYFIQLRLGDFCATSVTIPNFLYQQGMQQIIPPLATEHDQLWTSLGSYQIIAYPFVTGQTGSVYGMSAAHWSDFGVAICQLHAATLPTPLADAVLHEDFAPIWSERMRALLQTLPAQWADPAAQGWPLFYSRRQTSYTALSMRSGLLRDNRIACVALPTNCFQSARSLGQCVARPSKLGVSF